VVVRQVSSAVPLHNEELLAARAYGLPVLKRDAYLAQVRVFSLVRQGTTKLRLTGVHSRGW